MPDRIEKRFGRRLAVLPVVHVQNHAQALQNVKICIETKADGVFLISHSGDNTSLLKWSREFKQKWPEFFFGINLLGSRPESAHRKAIDHGLDGLWVDNAEDARISLRGTPLLYFGGCAFKTQSPIPDEKLASEALDAVYRMDVVTTSGTGTGIAAEDRRLKLMADALVGHDTPLAVASGVSAENVLGHIEAGAQAFLVASSISRNFHELDPSLLGALVRTVRSS